MRRRRGRCGLSSGVGDGVCERGVLAGTEWASVGCDVGVATAGAEPPAAGAAGDADADALGAAVEEPEDPARASTLTLPRLTLEAVGAMYDGTAC